MSSQTVKICLGLQLKTNGIVLKTFKTIFNEEILPQKWQTDRRKEFLTHHFITKDFKIETTK